MLTWIKEIFIIILNWIKTLLEYNRKYKIKLVIMIIFITISFITTLIYIIHKKSLTGFEPILVNINDNGILGKITNNAIFKIVTKTIFGYWNFGPSLETLLGLIIITSFILILLIIGSSYIKILILPLTALVTFISYNTYKILYNNYVITNTEAIFDRFGIILQKNVEIQQIELESSLERKITFFYEYWVKALGNKKYDDSNLDLVELKDTILELGLKDDDTITKFILEYFKQAYVMLPMDPSVNNTLSSNIPTIPTWIMIGTATMLIFVFMCYHYDSIVSWIQSLQRETRILGDATIKIHEETGILGESAVNQGESLEKLSGDLSAVADNSAKLNAIMSTITEEQWFWLIEFSEIAIRNNISPMDLLTFIGELGLSMTEAKDIIKSIEQNR